MDPLAIVVCGHTGLVTGSGKVVILNGAPRSGKSAIAAVMQHSFEGPWVNLEVDASSQSLPEHLRPGIGLRPGGERPELEDIATGPAGMSFARLATSQPADDA